MTAPTIVVICALGVIALFVFVYFVAPRLNDQRCDDGGDYCADEGWADRFHGGQF